MIHLTTTGLYMIKKIKNIYFNKLQLVDKLLFVILIAYFISPLISLVRYIFFLKDSNAVGYLKYALTFLNYFFRYGITLLFILVFLIFVYKFIQSKLSKNTVLVLLIVIFLIFIQYAGLKYLFYLNELNYPNYIYSKIGLSTQEINQFIFIDLIILAASSTVILTNISKMSADNYIKKLKLTLVIFGIVLAIIQSTYPFLNIYQLYISSNESYSDKFGKQYVYIESLSSFTPINSVIIHPPQGSEFPALGNQPVLRYFLYPRQLISGAVVDSQDTAKEIGKAYFIKVDSENVDISWPEINEEKNIIMFNGTDKVQYGDIRIHHMNDKVIYEIDFI